MIGKHFPQVPVAHANLVDSLRSRFILGEVHILSGPVIYVD